MVYKNDIINLAVVNYKVTNYYESDVENKREENLKLMLDSKAENLRRMLGMAEAAAARGANLILFPELALTGYTLFIDETIPQEDKVALAETVNGPSTKAFEALAKEKGVYIVWGMPEKLEEDATDIYNSAVVVGPEGLVGSYQKLHPYGSENMAFKRGEKPPMVFDTEWGPISLAICYDNFQFPELARWCVWKGSRLHLNPTASAEEVPNNNSRYAWKRCYHPHLEYLVLSSSVCVASANLAGWDKSANCGVYFGGGSYVLGPDNNPTEEVESTIYFGDLENYQNHVYVDTLDLTMAARHQCSDNPWGGGPDYRPSIYKMMFDEIN